MKFIQIAETIPIRNKIIKTGCEERGPLIFIYCGAHTKTPLNLNVKPVSGICTPKI